MRVRMASFSGLAVALVLILAGASPAGAQQVVKFGEGQTLTISGFISSTFFNDNGLFNGFGQGQNAEWAAPPAPLGYGASGKIGWRFPGVFLYHDLTSGKSMNVQLQLAAMKGSGPIATGNTRDAAATSNIGNGEASGLPQLEALLNFSRKSGNLT